MVDLKIKSIDGFAEPIMDDEITSEHLAWMNEQIAETLAKKARGGMGYTPLDHVRRTFKLDAS